MHLLLAHNPYSLLSNLINCLYAMQRVVPYHFINGSWTCLPGYSNLKIFLSGMPAGGSMNLRVQYILYWMKA